MTLARIYDIPRGSRLVLHDRHWKVAGTDTNGFFVEELNGSECTKLTFKEVDDAIAARDCEVLKPRKTAKQKALRAYIGNYETLDQLPEEKRRDARARLALVRAMELLERGGLKLTHHKLDERAVRAELRKLASDIAKDPGLFQPARGGSARNSFPIPKGRTLMKYLRLFREHDRNPVALIHRDHLKGPQGAHRSKLDKHQEEFIGFVEEKWLDARKPKIAPLYELAKAQFDPPEEAVAAGFRYPSLVTVRRRVNEMSKVVQDIGRNGLRQGPNMHGAGATSIRALMYGERVEVDQVYLSIFTDGTDALKIRRIDPDEVGEELKDGEIRRLWLHCMIDVATRLPLAWILSETADVDHAQAMNRMATRDKTREKVRYGCKGDPAPAVGIRQFLADNGSATRNAAVYGGQLGLGTMLTAGRTYHATDKPYIERLFATIQGQLLNFLPGYAGSRPGELPAYEAEKEAKLIHDELYGMLTRYFVDEYPRIPHRGTGMYGATPNDKLEQVLRERGLIDPPSPQDLRLHRGYKVEASTTSEGVKAFNLPFNSTQLQHFAAGRSKRVTVHLDPDDLRKVSITAEGQQEIITANLTMTHFNDCTLEDVLEEMEDTVKGDPTLRAIDAEILNTARARRARESGFFDKLPPSYKSLETLRKRANALAQVELVPHRSTGPTVSPGGIMDRRDNPAVHRVAAAETESLPRNDAGGDEPSKPKMKFTPITESKL